MESHTVRKINTQHGSRNILQAHKHYYLVHSHLQEEETEATRAGKNLPSIRGGTKIQTLAGSNIKSTPTHHLMFWHRSELWPVSTVEKCGVWGKMQRPHFSFQCEVRKDLLAPPTYAWRRLLGDGISMAAAKDTSVLMTGLSHIVRND